MSNLEKLRHWWVKRWHKRGTRRVLGQFLLALNLVVFPPVLSAIFWMLQNAGAIEDKSQFRSFVLCAAIGVVLVNAALYSAWSRWRSLPRFADHQLGIVLFVPRGHEDAEALIVDLYEAIKSDLRQRNLTDLASVHLLPSDLTVASPSAYCLGVSNPSETNYLIATTNARIVIFGEVSDGRIGGEEFRGFRGVSFTARATALDWDCFPVLFGAAYAEAAGRQVCVQRSVEAAAITDNISKVARFFCGVALLASRRWHDAQTVLETLMGGIAVSVHALPLFRANVRDCYEGALLLELAHLYRTEIVDRITDSHVDAAIARSVQLLAKISAISATPECYLLPDALMRFLRGQLAGGSAAVHDARQKLLRQESAPYLSAASLALWNGSLIDALEHYRRAGTQWPRGAGICHRQSTTERHVETERDVGQQVGEMILGVTRFLSALADLHPERTEVRCALAFVSDLFFHKKLAVRQFQRFLADSKTDERAGFDRLRQTAEILLNRY